MQEMRRNSRLRFFILGIVLILTVAADQITKFLCVKFLELGESVTIIPGVLNFTYIRNTGAAFGSLSNSRWIFMVMSVLMIVLLVCYIISAKDIKPMTAAILSMIAGGGIGNMIDRIALGYVIDFVDVKFLPFWKWIFNVADAFVSVGAVILVVLYIVHEIKHKKGKTNNVKTKLQG